MMVGFPEELQESARIMNPVKRLGSSEEVADVVAWVLGERASHVGASIVVDVGATVMAGSH